jgi:uridine kinase
VIDEAPRALLAIDGLDGSGKSLFAAALAAACEAEGAGPVVVFHVDDFRRPLPALAPGADEAAVYYDARYDYACLDACLRSFLAGVEGSLIPRFDSTTERIDGEKGLPYEGARLALVEGVFVLRATNLTHAPLIAVEVSEEEARRRVLARDTARGRPREVVEHRMNSRYFPAQRRYREAYDPVGRAAAVIDNEVFSRPRLVRCDTNRLPLPVASALARVVRS